VEISVNEKTHDNEYKKLSREEKFKMMMEKYPEDEQNNYVKKSKKAQERCCLLYEKGKIKHEVAKLINQKNSELKDQKEMSECTFKPKTNLLKKNVKEEFEEKKIYDRAISWKKNKIEKIDRHKAAQMRVDDNAFKPQLYKPNSQIFDPKKNLMNDFSSRNFMMRLENARVEEKTKKEILSKGGKITSKWVQKPMGQIRSVSQGDLISSNMNINLDMHSSNIGDVIKNLHNELHNFNIDEENI